MHRRQKQKTLIGLGLGSLVSVDVKTAISSEKDIYLAEVMFDLGSGASVFTSGVHIPESHFPTL